MDIIEQDIVKFESEMQSILKDIQTKKQSLRNQSQEIDENQAKNILQNIRND